MEIKDIKTTYDLDRYVIDRAIDDPRMPKRKPKGDPEIQDRIVIFIKLCGEYHTKTLEELIRLQEVEK